jgi:membrane protease YdiL (CAAX protease family)
MATLVAVLGVLLLAGGLPWHGVVVGLLVAPWCEEVLFRAGLHEALCQRAWLRATRVTLVALLFAAAHAAHHGVGQIAGIALAGLLLGVVYEHRRSWAPCVALHALMNAIYLAAAVFMPGRGGGAG